MNLEHLSDDQLDLYTSTVQNLNDALLEGKRLFQVSIGDCDVLPIVKSLYENVGWKIEVPSAGYWKFVSNLNDPNPKSTAWLQPSKVT